MSLSRKRKREVRRTVRALGGRRVLIEHRFGPRSPAYIAIAGGAGQPPIGAWISRGELRRLVEAAKRILK